MEEKHTASDDITSRLVVLLCSWHNNWCVFEKKLHISNEKVTDGGRANVTFCKKIPTVTHTIAYLE